jgi:hypothetical protein
MSSVSGVQAQPAQPVPQVKPAGTDADGDNDGTKSAAPAATTPFVAKPTATLGNRVNDTA